MGEQTVTSGSNSHDWQANGCPVCGANDFSSFLQLRRLPVNVGTLLSTREAALVAPSGDFNLVLCHGCGYIANQIFDRRKIVYEPGYDVSLDSSPLYKRFIEDLARRIVSDHQIYGRTVLEIGCGNGEFLEEICRAGSNEGLGFDPSYVPPLPVKETASIRFIPQYFTAESGDYRGDLVCCRHMMQQIPQPTELLTLARRATSDRPGALVYFEVPNVKPILEDLAVWIFMYEHPSYYCEESLRRLFIRSGFQVKSLATCFEGQYIGVEAAPSEIFEDIGPNREAVRDMERLVESFSDRFRQKVAAWQKTRSDLRDTGRRVVIWGAGGRAISFLNLLNVRQQIEYLVDINPRRQGAYIPGTGQLVVAPEFLREYRPDSVIISNPTFETEIRDQVLALGLNCEFLLA